MLCFYQIHTANRCFCREAYIPAEGHHILRVRTLFVCLLLFLSYAEFIRYTSACVGTLLPYSMAAKFLLFSLHIVSGSIMLEVANDILSSAGNCSTHNM